MIVTVTPNTAIDRTLFVPSFKLNQTIRASRVAIGMGGKAADASWVLGELGIPSLALGFAAGQTGQQMEAMLQSRGVTTDFVWVQGETRTNTLVVCEDGSGQSTITVETLTVGPADVEALLARYRTALAEGATCVVMGGSVPPHASPSIYTQMIQEAVERGIPVVFDASGAALRAGLAGGPTFIKPNRAELEEIVGHPISSVETAYQAARDIQQSFGTSLVVTLGEEGALAVLPDRAYRIPPLQVEVSSTAGAGDGVLAGLAAVLSRGRPLEDGLRLGFAAAGAILMTPATADCRRADVERLVPLVELIPYGEGH